MAEGRRTSTGLAIATTVAACLLAGCGTVTRVGADRTLDVALSEYRINPRASTVSAGVLTLIVRNYGRLTHNLVVAENGLQDGATPSIPPGGEATIVIVVSPGRYTLSSTILQDADLGARGTLTVT